MIVHIFQSYNIDGLPFMIKYQYKSYIYGYLFWGLEGTNNSDEAVLRILINSEKEVICRLDKGKFERIKKGQ